MYTVMRFAACDDVPEVESRHSMEREAWAAVEKLERWAATYNYHVDYWIDHWAEPTP